MSGSIIQQVVLGKDDFDKIMALLNNVSSPLPKKEESEEVFTVDQAAKFLKCSRNTVYNLMNESGLPFHNLTSNRCLIKSEIVEWLKKR